MPMVIPRVVPKAIVPGAMKLEAPTSVGPTVVRMLMPAVPENPETALFFWVVIL